MSLSSFTRTASQNPLVWPGDYDSSQPIKLKLRGKAGVGQDGVTLLGGVGGGGAEYCEWGVVPPFANLANVSLVVDNTSGGQIHLDDVAVGSYTCQNGYSGAGGGAGGNNGAGSDVAPDIDGIGGNGGHAGTTGGGGGGGNGTSAGPGLDGDDGSTVTGGLGGKDGDSGNGGGNGGNATVNGTAGTNGGGGGGGGGASLGTGGAAGGNAYATITYTVISHSVSVGTGGVGWTISRADFAGAALGVTLLGSGASNDSTLWSTNGDGRFADATALHTTYFPGLMDVYGIISGGTTLTLTGIKSGSSNVTASDQIILTGTIPNGANSQGYQVGDVASAYSHDSSYAWTTAGNGIFNDSHVLSPKYTPTLADSQLGHVNLTLTTPQHVSTVLIVPLTPYVSAGSNQIAPQSSTTIQLAGAVAGSASPQWTTAGDGSFNDSTSLTAIYTLGTQDKMARFVTLTLTGTLSGLPGSSTMTISLRSFVGAGDKRAASMRISRGRARE